VGWGGLLKDWNKPKPEPEPVEPPPIMDDLRVQMNAQQQLTALQMQQKMYEMQQMQNMGFGGGLQNALGSLQQYHGLFNQAPPLPPVPLTQVVPMRATIYGREVKTLSARHIVSGLSLTSMQKDEVEQYVRRELAYKLAQEIAQYIAVVRMPDMSNRDGVIYETTVHIAFEERK
jgi:hypothetical protein